MVGPFLAPGAAASDASVRLAVGANNHSPVRSHVPGTPRDRAPAEEAGIQKAKPVGCAVHTFSFGERCTGVIVRRLRGSLRPFGVPRLRGFESSWPLEDERSG